MNGYCRSGFAAKDASGERLRWEPWVNGQGGVYAAACPDNFRFGTVFVLPGGEVFQCWDRGGKIKMVNGMPWLDLMVQSPPVDYGTVVAVTVYDGLGPHNVPIKMAWPYHDFWITQGTHGAWYGHSAIDIRAGEGSPILAPLTGRVLANGYAMGNTELMIESDRYVVTLWHGNYTPQAGQLVYLGDTVGTEGNNGYTTDGWGNPCYGKAHCGYHTHLNVFDKFTGLNVDPRDVMTEWSN